MAIHESFSKAKLLEIIERRGHTLATQTKQLATQTEQLATQTEQLATQSKELAQKSDIIKQLEAKIEQAEKDYLKLWQERFGAKSERYIDDPDQLRLDFGDSDEAADAAAGLAEAAEEAGLVAAHKRRKPKKKRDESLPAHLPREEVIIDVAPADKQCKEHGEKTLLPESIWDTTERMVYVPPKLYVEVRRFPKYACSNQPQCGIASAERPTMIKGQAFND